MHRPSLPGHRHAGVALLWTALAALSADEVPVVPPLGPNPPPPQVEPQNATLDLLKVLPSVASIVVKDNAVYWQDADKATYQIVDVVQQDQHTDPIISTPIGKIQVTRSLIADNRTDLLDQLPQLVAQAKSAGLSDAAGLPHLLVGIMTGLQLSWNDGTNSSLVISEGTLKKAAIPPVDRAPDRERLLQAVKGAIADLPHSDLDDLGRTCLQEFLLSLTRPDTERISGELAPSHARRMVRCGWLRQFYAPQDAADVATLEQSVVQAEKFWPVSLFEGPSLRFAQVADAFSRTGWTLVTPTRTAYMVQHQVPSYYQAWPDEKPFLVVDLAPGADPTLVSAAPLAARLYRTLGLDGAEQIAAWKKDKPLQVNRDVWRATVPAGGRKVIDANATSDFMPPHLLVTALNGDVIQLVVAGGTLTPPANGGEAEGERFLADAAKVLPDPSNLDLIGEYLVQICQASPDSRHPDLVGTRSLSGDSHQTAGQTIATACAGLMRGESDDLAELYQTIAQRQGRTAQLIAMPHHAAMSFAEKREDGNWHAYVLCAGAPCEFAEAKLPDALERACRGLDDGNVFDANAMGLLVRFAGENTRNTCYLSWRMFADPEYAKTMIDVQSDWHFQTYSRGIRDVTKLIASGDSNSANYRALADLYRATGQYDQAIDALRHAIDRSDGDRSQLELSIGMVQLLYTAHQPGPAHQLAEDLIDRLHALRKDPDLGEHLDASQAELGARLATSLCHYRDYDLALRALKATQLDFLAAHIRRFADHPSDPVFAQTLERYIPSAIAVLRGFQPGPGRSLAQNADLQTVQSTVQTWLDLVAFQQAPRPADLMNRYAAAGRFYGATFGDELLMAMIESAGSPSGLGGRRVGGVTQTQFDMPWIKYSVPFWSERLTSLFTGDPDQIDSARVARLGVRVSEAVTMCGKLGIDHPDFHHQAQISAFIAALIGHDANRLRELVRVVKRSGDRSLRDDTARWLGDLARYLDMDWYQQAVQIWHDGINDPQREYQLKYLWIAWRAALHAAPRQALLVAKRAATELKDPAYAEEYDYLQSLPAQAAAASEAAHALLTPAVPGVQPPAPDPGKAGP